MVEWLNPARGGTHVTYFFQLNDSTTQPFDDPGHKALGPYNEIAKGHGTDVHLRGLDDSGIGYLFRERGIPAALHGDVSGFIEGKGFIIRSLSNF